MRIREKDFDKDRELDVWARYPVGVNERGRLTIVYNPGLNNYELCVKLPEGSPLARELRRTTGNPDYLITTGSLKQVVKKSNEVMGSVIGDWPHDEVID